jgi:dihydrofolate reductase
VGGRSLHGWAFATRTFQQHLFGNDGGETGIDDDFAARGFHNMGTWILGRTMFGPIRGLGRTRPGGVGGAKIRCITYPYSC